MQDVPGRVRSFGPWGPLLYGALYVLAVLLFVPGIVLTLGAGYIFGVVPGVILVSVASTTAATLAFLIARHFARERVRAVVRRNPRFAAIDRAIAREGWKIVALLRLSPLVPFSFSNYLYGVTSVPLPGYVLASWLAMLPATVLYVSLGAAGRTLRSGATRTPGEWALLGLGIAATVAVTVMLGRIARKALTGTPAGE